MAEKFPGWRYGPKGQSRIFQSEADVPKGWVDHPSLLKGAEAGPGGTKTAVTPANSSVSAAEAAQTTGAETQTHTDPAIAAKSGVGGEGNSAAVNDVGREGDPGIDAHGHPYDPALHAATQSKTTAGLWRMKVGVARPDPAPGYPLDL